MGLRDLVRDEQAQARPFAAFRREEQAERLLSRLLFHPDAVVLDLEPDVPIVSARPKRDAMIRLLPIQTAGIERVLAQVDEQRTDGLLVPLELTGGRRDLGGAEHTRLPRPVGHLLEHIVDEHGRVERLPVRLAVLGVVENLEHHRADALDVALDDVPALDDARLVAGAEPFVDEVHAAVQAVQQPLQPVRDRADEETDGRQLGLQFANGRDVGAHLHHGVDPVGPRNRRRVHEDVHGPAVARGHDLLVDPHLPVLEGLADDARVALLGSVLVDFPALAAEERAERLPVKAVGVDDVQIAVLDRDVAGHLFEEGAVPGLAAAELALELFDVRNVRGHLHDGADLATLVPDRFRVDDDRDLAPVDAGDAFFASVSLPVLEAAFDGADLALLSPLFVHLVAVAALGRAERVAEPAVGFEDPEVPILDGQIAGHRIEALLVRQFHLGILRPRSRTFGVVARAGAGPRRGRPLSARPESCAR